MPSHSVTISVANPEDAEGIAKVHVDAWNETYSGIVPQEHLKSRRYEERTVFWRKLLTELQPPKHVIVAKDLANEIIGFSSGGPNRDPSLLYDGEIFAIYLLKKYHGLGFGKKLFESSKTILASHGFTQCLVWVLRDNPSRPFYVWMGGKVVGEKMEEIGGKSLPEFAYGWDNISAS